MSLSRYPCIERNFSYFQEEARTGGNPRSYKVFPRRANSETRGEASQIRGGKSSSSSSSHARSKSHDPNKQRHPSRNIQQSVHNSSPGGRQKHYSQVAIGRCDSPMPETPQRIRSPGPYRVVTWCERCELLLVDMKRQALQMIVPYMKKLKGAPLKVCVALGVIFIYFATIFFVRKISSKLSGLFRLLQA